MMEILNDEILHTSLANGLQVTVVDNSKRMAADRWYVKINCLAQAPLPAQKLATLTLESEQLAAFVEHTQGNLQYRFSKERNFVDEGVKAEVVEELMGQIHSTALPYLATDSFLANLFDKSVEDFVQEYQVRQEMGLDLEEEEDDGPADFSACFQDHS